MTRCDTDAEHQEQGNTHFCLRPMLVLIPCDPHINVIWQNCLYRHSNPHYFLVPRWWNDLPRCNIVFLQKAHEATALLRATVLSEHSSFFSYF